MGRPAWIVVGVCCLALAATLPVATVGPAAGAAPLASADAIDPVGASQERTDGGADGPTPAPAAVQQGEEYDGLQLELHVQHDGDVVWTYRYVYPIDAEEDRQAFEDYAERFEAEETQFYTDWRAQSVELTERASAELDREMEATAFEREATVEPTPTGDVGYVELSYRWTNFAAVDGDAVVVGDVFDGGFYLREDQSLAFEAGENLTFQSVAPEGTLSGPSLEDSDVVTWSGERRFPDQQPRATLRIENDSGGAAGDETMDVSAPILLGGGFVLLVFVLLAVAFVRGDLPEVEDVRSDAGSDAVGSQRSTTDAVDAAATDADESDATDADATPDPSTLSDEERVQALLESEDGRMKQSEIVDETEWSKSKVSMLLSDMEDEGTISKIQVGRENIIALEGSEPEAASSPFDDNE